MTTTIQRFIPQRDPLKREIVPTGWEMSEEVSPLDRAKASFRAWDADIAKYEELFKKFVYDNVNLRELDIRRHRGSLHGLIANGEALAVDMLTLGDTEAKSYAALIDAKVQALNAVLTEWHGGLSVEDDPNIPDSFKEASRQVAAGEVEDFEDDMICENAAS